MDASLMYYMHVNPTELTDEEWCLNIARLAEIRKREGMVSG
jgi:hypothetical protein